MIEFELNMKQIYELSPLVTELKLAYAKDERGMIIAQIIVPDMVVRAEFLEHGKAKAVIEAMENRA